MPVALLALSAIPLAFGAVRLTHPAGGAAITPANARCFASPVLVVLHWSCTSCVPPCLPSWARSSSPPASGGAGPAGTVLLDGCSSLAACWSGFRGCG
jgi:hypothetical protein